MKIDQETKEKALDLLYEHGYRALREVEQMLGGREYTNYELSQALGVTQSKIKYLMYRKERLEKSRLRTQNLKTSKALSLEEYRCDALGFSISLPADWKVHGTRTLVDELDAIDDIRAAFEQAGYNVDRGLIRDGILSRSSNMGVAPSEVSIFLAEQPGSLARAELEVVKIQLKEPLTALRFYELDKLPAEEVVWGNRPGRTKQIDNLETVKYYYCPSHLEPKFSNLYMVDDLTGWVVSAFCENNYFDQYKFIFERIQTSFRRL